MKPIFTKAFRNQRKEIKHIKQKHSIAVKPVNNMLFLIAEQYNCVLSSTRFQFKHAYNDRIMAAKRGRKQQTLSCTVSPDVAKARVTFGSLFVLVPCCKSLSLLDKNSTLDTSFPCNDVLLSKALACVYSCCASFK